MASKGVRVLRVNVWNYAKIEGKLRAEIRAVVNKHIWRIVRDIRAMMRQPKSGNIYYYRGRRIRASAPGEAPAVRSGKLFRNVVPIVQNNGMQATIDPQKRGVRYAPWLELGTTRMKPRPYLRPGFDRRRQAFVTEIRTKLAKAI